MPVPPGVDTGDFYKIPGLSAGALNADLVPAMDVSQYKWISLYIRPTAYVGTLEFQGTFDPDDPSSWEEIWVYSMDSLQSLQSGTSTSATNVRVGVPVWFPWFRVRMTAYTSGVAEGVLHLHRQGLSGFQMLNTGVTLYDGANVTQGANADAAVSGDAAGTLSAKMRGLNKVFGAQNDSAASSDTGTFSLLAFVKRLMQKLPNIGQQVKAASLSIVLASDHDAVKCVKDTVLLYQTTLTGVTTTGDSGNLDVSKYSEVIVIYNVTSFTGTSVEFRHRTVDEHGNSTSINGTAALSATGAGNLSAGTGIQGGSLGKNYRIEWKITSATVSATVCVYAK